MAGPRGGRWLGRVRTGFSNASCQPTSHLAGGAYSLLAAQQPLVVLLGLGLALEFSSGSDTLVHPHHDLSPNSGGIMGQKGTPSTMNLPLSV